MRQGAHYLSALCGLVLVMGWGLPVLAQTEPSHARPVLIVELQTASQENAHDKFVVIYNPNPLPLDVTDWQLQYRAASAVSDAPWHTTATLNCELVDEVANRTCRVQLPALGKLWLASYDLGPDRPSHDLKSSMAVKGGQVRLVQSAHDDQTEEQQDMVGYGNALVSNGDQPASAPPKGQSLKRRVSADGQFINTNNNANDFFVEDRSGVQPPDIPAEPSDPKQNTAETYPTITIVELLPLTASNAGGFIKLYNPQDTPVSLQNYILQTGLSWSHHFTLPDKTINGHGYMAFYNSDTHLQLSRKGSAARLLNPNGDVVSSTKPYVNAKSDQSWAQTADGDWQWTTTPTPGAANILTVPLVHKAGSAASSKPPKPSSQKTPVDKKPKAAKTSTKKAKADTKPKATTPTPVVTQSASSASKPNANYWFIGAAVALAGGYACFEYRQDLMGLVQKVRSKFKKN